MNIEKNTKAVYGPIKSWRYGNSLGIDLLLNNSICSFNCIYCQLGEIQVITKEQKEYVPTSQVEEELREVDMDSVDIVAISGSGEPTLATNLGEVIHHIKATYNKPVMVLTNATMLWDKSTRERLLEADIVDCKLDAADDAILQRYNRPVEGITVKLIVDGIKALRSEHPGRIHMQCMFMPLNVSQAETLADIIRDIKPDLVQMNTPRRPHPARWDVAYRHSEGGQTGIPEAKLKTISIDTAKEIEEILKNTGVKIQSVFRF